MKVQPKSIEFLLLLLLCLVVMIWFVDRQQMDIRLTRLEKAIGSNSMLIPAP